MRSSFLRAMHSSLLFAILSVRCIALGAEPSSELIGSWSFENTEGRLVLDDSPNANHAIACQGTLVRGVVDAGLQFDGRATTANCPHTPGISPTRGLTLEAWFQLHELPTDAFPAVLRKDNSFALRFSSGRLGFLLWLDGQLVTIAVPDSAWETGKWYHVAATYDDRQMRLFLNGKEVAQSPRAASGSIDPSDSPLGIGCCGSQYSFHGVIDEVRVYENAISEQAITASYRAGLESLQQQTGEPVQPRKIGTGAFEFRKPPRAIREVVNGFLWIDAEDFQDYGGWSLDTQFVHLMGSAYLIATGVGQRVNDAMVDVQIPRAGTWRLWVRSKDWLPECSPGRFVVRVGDELSAADFGADETDQWGWRSGGEFELAAGKTRLALHDLTGYYGRCDALLLTTDLDYQPPKDVAAVVRERSRLTGVSLAPRLAGEFDVIVVGAGSAGGPAAIASARMGAKTALIQNRPVLGGNASIELGVPICGASVAHRNARESGIIEELGRIRARYSYPKMSEPMRVVAEQEPNLKVFSNQHVFAVEMLDETQIGAVRAVETLTGEISIYRGRQFVDCTGDGWVGYFAGAEYHLGREARDEFNEDLAPRVADKITMSGCLMGQRALSFRAEHAGRPVVYHPPPCATQLPPIEQFGRNLRRVTGGEWWLEHPGTIDDLWDAERARDELIRISFGYWDLLKNHWAEREQAAEYQLTYIPITDAKRESRRLVGDYMLTQNDVQSGRVFPDRISYGGWSLDVHHPKGVYSGTEGPFDFDPHVPIYTIPYRCLYSKNIENLLFAGRNMSVTHVALGTVRVQGTLATTGQAAGTAAAMCIERNLAPRELGRTAIKELQQTLLKHDQYIPELANEDPADLARTATIRATSTATYEPFGREHLKRGEDTHPLNTPRAVMLPRGLKQNWRSVSLLLSSSAKKLTEVTLHVRASAAAQDFSSNSDLAVVSATVPPGIESYVTFPMDRKIDSPFVWFWLEPHADVSWRLMEGAPIGSARAYGGGFGKPWTVISNQQYAIATDPPLAIPANYAPENAINGVARIVGDDTNLWASDPEQPLPQSLELRFPSPTKFNSVYLTFDTELNNRYHNLPLVPQCVRDYTLSYFDGDGWVGLFCVSGNFQRQRIHRFDEVTGTQLRLTVTATNGAPSARLFEIRVYDE